MGKIIVVHDIIKCKKCVFYEKIGCYFSICTNKKYMKDNFGFNELIYEQT